MKKNVFRFMEFENFIEVGNLCRAGRTLEKNMATPGTPPPYGGGADKLARQQLRRREFVERRANVSGIIKVPPTNKRVCERLHCVSVERLKVIN